MCDSSRVQSVLTCKLSKLQYHRSRRCRTGEPGTDLSDCTSIFVYSNPLLYPLNLFALN